MTIDDLALISSYNCQWNDFDGQCFPDSDARSLPETRTEGGPEEEENNKSNKNDQKT